MFEKCTVTHTMAAKSLNNDLKSKLNVIVSKLLESFCVECTSGIRLFNLADQSSR